MVVKHYKGGLYRIIGECTHTETNERLIAYISIATGELWVRPYSMFYEDIVVDGMLVKRFEPVGIY